MYLEKIDIEEDSEFYAYLKRYLPTHIRIETDPSAEYFSEYLYRYKIFINERIVEDIQGDFRNIRKGELVNLAEQILKKYSI